MAVEADGVDPEVAAAAKAKRREFKKKQIEHLKQVGGRTGRGPVALAHPTVTVRGPAAFVSTPSVQLEERNRQKRVELEEQEKKSAKVKARVASKSASARSSMVGDRLDGAVREKTPEEQMADKLLARQQQYLQQWADKRRKVKENEEAAEESAKLLMVKVSAGWCVCAPVFPLPSPPYHVCMVVVACEWRQVRQSTLSRLGSFTDPSPKAAVDAPVRPPPVRAKPKEPAVREEDAGEGEAVGPILPSSAGLMLDEARWRKRHGLETSHKVFVMTGWYPDVQKALFARGWKQVRGRGREWGCVCLRRRFDGRVGCGGAEPRPGQPILRPEVDVAE